MRAGRLGLAGRALLLAGLASWPGRALAAAARPPGPGGGGVALALSGGGARGIAHVGVLKGLEACRIPIASVAGTSMGAIIGGLYAAGYTPGELEELVRSLDWTWLLSGTSAAELPLARREERSWALLELELSGGKLDFPAGLVGTERFEEWLAVQLLRAKGSTDFGGLGLPFRAVATDLETGQRVVLSEGSLTLALRASMAVPGVFRPVTLGGRLLVDGGLADNLPAGLARESASVVVAVDVSSPLRDRASLASFVTVLDQALSLSLAQGVARARGEADLVIEPAIGATPAFEFPGGQLEDLVRCGEEAALEACAAIRELLRERGERDVEEPRVGGKRRDRVTLGRFRVTGVRGRSRELARRVLGPAPASGSIPLGDLQERLGRLRGLGVYEHVHVERAGGPDERREIEVALEERAPVRLSFAARYDDKVDLLGRLAVASQRLVAGVQALSADLSFGSAVAARLGARQDLLLDRPLLASLDVFHLDQFDRLVVGREDLGRLRIRQKGVEVSLGAALSPSLLVAGGYRITRVTLDTEAPLEPFPKGARGIGEIRGRLALDTTGGRAYPARGTVAGGTLRLARRALGGRADFSLLEGSGLQHLPLGERTTLTTRLRGAVTLAGTLEPSAELAVGGNDVFPGYARDELRVRSFLAAGVRLNRRILDLPPALGRGLWLGLDGGAGKVAAASRPELAEPHRLHHGVAALVGLDTRLGPFELAVGVGRGGRREVTYAAGPVW